MQESYRYPQRPELAREKPASGRKRWFLLLPIMLLSCCGLCSLFYVVFPPANLDISLMGLDTRGAEGKIARSDVNMIIGIDPGHLRVSILSIPRDLFIQTPGYGMQRINTINVLGESEAALKGIHLYQAAIEENFEIKLDRYIRLDFNAFKALIDAVGGVDIYVEKVLEDYQYPTVDGGTESIRFESGWNHMDGERALKYARTRHLDDDYKRNERQQAVISAFVSRLVNPIYWGPVLNVLQHSVETDLNPVDLLRIAPILLINAGNFDTLVINRDYILPAEGYAVPNYDKVLPWVRERFD